MVKCVLNSVPRAIPFRMRLADGITPAVGKVLTGNELRVSINFGAETNFAGSISEIGGGRYAYLAGLTEVVAAGWVRMRVNRADLEPAIIVFEVISSPVVVPPAAFTPASGMTIGFKSGWLGF